MNQNRVRVDFFSGPVKPTYPTEFQGVFLPAGSVPLKGNTERCILLLSETHKVCFRLQYQKESLSFQ